MGERARAPSSSTWGRAVPTGVCLFLAGMVLAAVDVAYSETSPRLAAALQILLGGALGATLLFVARADRSRAAIGAGQARGLHPWTIPAGLALLFVWTVAITGIGALYYPLSADEYGYTYLSDTLLHGRLWNAPTPLPRILDCNYVYERGGKLFSQYAPGWPAVLAPFRALGVPWIANPLLTVALGWLSLLTLRRAGAREPLAIALSVLLMASPFVVLNGASRFSHTLTGVMVLLIVWAQLRDEAKPSVAMRALIGFAFSVLLVARYEAFAITAVLFVADRLIARRARFVVDAIPMALGGLPLALAFIAYNKAITGSPFVTPLQWSNEDSPFGLTARGHDVAGGIATGLVHQLRWSGELSEYAGAGLAALAAWALWTKLRAHTVRFYDLLLPGAIAFYFFNMENGGVQYGPRYWFFGWVTVMLTIATALAAPDGTLRLARLRIDPVRLALAHLAVFLGITLVIAVWTRSYIEARRAVYDVQPPTRPALVLVPDRWLSFSLGPWHRYPVMANAFDFVRNGTDFDGDVWWGRLEKSHDAEIACRVTGRAVYLWVGPHTLSRLECGQAP
jgi:hypothetical protein